MSISIAKYFCLSATLMTMSCGQISENAKFSKEDVTPEKATGFHKKPLTISEKDMVSAANPLAVQAGNKILRMGGSAVDAAIAVQLVLNLVEPQSSGIGGGGFLVHYDAKTQNLISFDGRETAPSAAHEDIFLDENGKALPLAVAALGGHAVGVPGLVDMLSKAHKAHGVLPWETLFEPAMTLAKNGFSLSPRLHGLLEVADHYKDMSSEYKLYFDEKGTLYPIGTTIKNPAFAETLEDIAQNGAKAFYTGDIAKDIIQTVQNAKHAPSRMTLEDLENYTSKTRTVPCVNYHEYRLCGMAPPSSGGVTVLQALKMLEPFDMKNQEPMSAESVHLIASALRLAYADRNKYLADPDFISVPTGRLLNNVYLRERASQYIKKDKVIPFVSAGDPSEPTVQYASLKLNEPPSTTHVSIIDQNGNAVSMTTTIERAFGSGLSAEGGFILNNEMTDFDFVPQKDGFDVANKVTAEKRPRSSMAPFIVFDKEGKVKLTIGSPGGARIISYVLPRIIAVLDWDMPLDEAMNMPNMTAMKQIPLVEIEARKDTENLVFDLEKMGYEVISRDLTSGLHAVEVEGDTLYGAADPRREGIALGNE